VSWKEAIWQVIVTKGRKKMEKEIVLTEHVMNVAHMVTKRQIVGNFLKTRIKDPITGYQGK
jgi:hypothetical protein